MNDKEIILKLENISKTFYGTHALTNVNFEVRKGEIHALLGENGAGKSTLLNILSGAFPSDSGDIYLCGKKINIKTPLEAKKLGINKVSQELQLIPELSVGQNICLGSEPMSKLLKTIHWSKLHQQANRILSMLGADFESRDPVSGLSTAQMQIVEIAKALKEKSVVLALDEPTSSLTFVEIERLFKILKELRNSGTAIIYVTHRLDEVFEIADRVTVLRDGKYMGTFNVKEVSKSFLIKLMVGREIAEEIRPTLKKNIGEVILEVRDVPSKGNFKASFYLRKGEILGFAGLVGAGRTELIRKIFGADFRKGGIIFLRNKKIKIKSPRDAVRNGIAFLPEDRKRQGFVPLLTNCSNICLPQLPSLSLFGIMRRNKMAKRAFEVINALRIVPPDIEKPTRDLSGGNQQKVVLGKWLSPKYQIMIFDEPTRGIDVGAKAEIHKLMHDLASEGRSIIMISSELSEILLMSDRIIVMREGKIMGELMREEASEEKLLKLAMGVA
ncbi:TPA: sugar ABC transporter ATP-binding protein [Candidatus Poribacteria bacterium]|nr:sugar ABC transporter ATP-binding protein [Candidatus Poribacteria bacterium]